MLEGAPAPRAPARSAFVHSQSRIDHAAGFLAASVYSLSYYVVPAWLALAAALLVKAPAGRLTWAVTAPVIASALLPPMASRRLLRTWAFQQIPAYFGYQEILETNHEQMAALVRERPTIISLHPHGVFPMVSLCAAAKWQHSWWDPHRTVTAVASSILTIPLLKHVVGTLGISSASSGPLTQTLSSQDTHGVILYPGGTSELFLANAERERLFILTRKGVIRLGLVQGAAIVPGYLFGNTKTLKLVQWPVLRWISRKTGVALTYLYGRFYLPMPLPAQCVTVIGTPILLPKTETPSQYDVDHWHAVYVQEVQRIFDTYKGEVEGYETTVLEME